MKKNLLSVGLLTSAIGLIGSTAWANPCQPIAQACMKLGYYKGGDKVGKGLIKDCVMPVVAHSKTLPSLQIDDSQMQQCDALIKSKMKTQ